MIQPNAARFVSNNFARLSSVSTMLEHLGWDTLEKRCDQLTLMMIYKIINNLVEIPYSHILVGFPFFTRSTANNFIHLYARIDSYKFSFLSRAIRLWNSLPHHIIKSDTFDSFKHLIM